MYKKIENYTRTKSIGILLMTSLIGLFAIATGLSILMTELMAERVPGRKDPLNIGRDKIKALVGKEIPANIFETWGKPEISRGKRQIKSQFNPWNYSHIRFTRSIKNGMYDPKSYEHIETVYWELDEHLFVQTKYRELNAMGEKVEVMVQAKVNMRGDVIEILNVDTIVNDALDYK